MTRLHRLIPGEMTEAQRRMYDAVVAGPRRGTRGLVDDEGRLGGPLNTLLYAPAIGTAQQALGAALSYELSLPRRVAEVVILTVAHAAGSEFQVAAHEPMAHDLGLTDAELVALRERRDPRLADPAEQTAWRTAVQLLDAGGLDDRAYADAVSALGEQGLVELTTLVGYYRLVALQLRTFHVSKDAYTGPTYASPVTA